MGCCAVLSHQSCLTLCDLMDCSPPGSSVLGILQARILEWVTISYSRGSSWPRDWTNISCISCIAGRFFTCWAMGWEEVSFYSLKNKKEGIKTNTEWIKKQLQSPELAWHWGIGWLDVIYFWLSGTFTGTGMWSKFWFAEMAPGQEPFHLGPRVYFSNNISKISQSVLAF